MNVQSHLRMDKPAFLDWVQGREGRYELAGRRVVMMTGGSRAHAEIIKNLVVLLHERIDRRKWTVVADFGVDLGPETLRYPDVMVISRGAARNSLTVTAPLLIAEVISPSSATLDLGDKATEYLNLPSLCGYLVFDQDEPKAWAWLRTPDGFKPGAEIISGPAGIICVPPLEIELALSDIYADLE
jgi:Uma2 family endonuclease